MDPSLLITDAFWGDTSPLAMSAADEQVPDLSGTPGHIYFQTSGSMGAPKWLALSRHGLRRSAEAVNAHLGVCSQSCWGLLLPLHHVGGFGVAARAHQAGCRLAVREGKWNAAEATAWLAAEGVTHSSMVPTQIHDLVNAGLSAPDGLRVVVVGGGRLPQELGEAARRLGWPVLASYGMTEAGSQIATQGLDALNQGYRTTPMPVLEHWQLRLNDDGQLCLAGEALFVGELLQEQDGWTFRERVGEWFQTNDRVALDGDLLSPLGRADLQVKVMGELVDLEDLEAKLMAMSTGRVGNRDMVIVAMPDERKEHALVPIFDASLERATVDEMLAQYAAQAPGHQRLQEAVFLSPLPRSPLGKPRREQCLERLQMQS